MTRAKVVLSPRPGEHATHASPDHERGVFNVMSRTRSRFDARGLQRSGGSALTARCVADMALAKGRSDLACVALRLAPFSSSTAVHKSWSRRTSDAAWALPGLAKREGTLRGEGPLSPQYCPACGKKVLQRDGLARRVRDGAALPGQRQAGTKDAAWALPGLTMGEESLRGEGPSPLNAVQPVEGSLSAHHVAS